MKINWYVSDGYANNGVHYLEINDAELNKCEDDNAKEIFIDKCIQEAFNEEVGFYYEIQEVEDENNV